MALAIIFFIFQLRRNMPSLLWSTSNILVLIIWVISPLASYYLLHTITERYMIITYKVTETTLLGGVELFTKIFNDLGANIQIFVDAHPTVSLSYINIVFQNIGNKRLYNIRLNISLNLRGATVNRHKWRIENTFFSNSNYTILTLPNSFIFDILFLSKYQVFQGDILITGSYPKKGFLSVSSPNLGVILISQEEFKNKWNIAFTACTLALVMILSLLIPYIEAFLIAS